MRQVVLPFLPGYMFDGFRLRSTGIALPPTQHVCKKTGEIKYYCRPLWNHSGPRIGLYVRHKGLVEWINKLGREDL